MQVRKLGVVGAGQMGQGIAQVAAQSGIDVVIVDAAPDFAQMGVAKIKKTLDRLVERGKLEGAARDGALSHLKAGGAHRDLTECDVVIEAAPEKEDLKLGIFKSLGDVCRDDAICPAGIGQAGFFGHIGKRAVAIVVIQSASRGMWIAGSVHRQSVGEVNVQATIVVVVKERHSSADGFDDVFFFGSGNMPEGNAGSIGDINKMRMGFLVLGSL